MNLDAKINNIKQKEAELFNQIKDLKKQKKSLVDERRKLLKEAKEKTYTPSLEDKVREDAIKYLKDKNLDYGHLPKVLDLLAEKYDYLDIRPVILLRNFYGWRNKIEDLIDYDTYNKAIVVVWHHKAKRRKTLGKTSPKPVWHDPDNDRYHLTYKDLIEKFKSKEASL